MYFLPPSISLFLINDFICFRGESLASMLDYLLIIGIMFRLLLSRFNSELEEHIYFHRIEMYQYSQKYNYRTETKSTSSFGSVLIVYLKYLLIPWSEPVPTTAKEVSANISDTLLRLNHWLSCSGSNQANSRSYYFIYLHHFFVLA